MLRLGRVQALQKFIAVRPSIHSHFNQERHLYSRIIFKQTEMPLLPDARDLVRIGLRLRGELKQVRTRLTTSTGPEYFRPHFDLISRCTLRDF